VNSCDSFAGQTVEAARRRLSARFTSASIESAELDARLVVGRVLGLDLTGLITAAARRVDATEAAHIEAFAQRRIGGEPVARILGEKEFWGLPLLLSPATLVPRPDTETVVELALDMLPLPRPGHRLRILEIGTGSGAILLALLSERADALGVGTDMSLAALQAARGNARNLDTMELDLAGRDLASRAAFVACDHAAALSGRFDLIVSNPPYVRSCDIAGLAAEVRDHDPLLALDGGPDGLDAYRALIPQAVRLLAPGGALVVEAGIGQSRQVEGLMTKAWLTLQGAPKTDLAGVARAVAGRKMAR
jgi:release factor glutamine methyltransferase